MNDRLFPLRNKPPDGFPRLASLASELRLFLLNEQGPTHQLFKDEHDRKFKVNIGSTISCSCSKAKDHCAHTVQVLNKLFHIPVDDPLIQQKSQASHEIDKFVQRRFEGPPRQKEKQTSYLRRKKAVSGGAKGGEDEDGNHKRLTLEEEGNCPICQMELCEGDELTWCRKGCGHNIHADCMKHWAEHKKCSSEKVVCPLCRAEFGTYIMSDISEDKKQCKKKNQSMTHLGFKCNSCKQNNIAGERFRCIICPNQNLCRKCQAANQHQEHFFIFKKQTDEEFKPARRYNKKEKERLEESRDRILGELQQREFSADDYEVLQELDTLNNLGQIGANFEYKIPMYKQLAESFPRPKFNQYSMFKCMQCSTTDPKSMTLKLDCEHQIHDRCLSDHFRENAVCLSCSIPVFSGQSNSCNEHLMQVKDNEKKSERKFEAEPDSHWSFGSKKDTLDLGLTGKNAISNKANANVSKNGVPKKIPKRNASQTRAEPSTLHPTSNQRSTLSSQSQSLSNQQLGPQGLEIGTGGLSNTRNRDNSLNRLSNGGIPHNRQSNVLRTNARNILSAMEESRVESEEVMNVVNYRRAALTQRVATNTRPISSHTETNEQVSTNYDSNSQLPNSNSRDITVASTQSSIPRINNSQLNNSQSHQNSNSQDHQSLECNYYDSQSQDTAHTFDEVVSQPEMRTVMHETNTRLDKNLERLEALEQRDEAMNNHLNSNIDDINELLRQINNKIAAGNLDPDEQMLYQMQLQEINGDILGINQNVTNINHHETNNGNVLNNDDKITEDDHMMYQDTDLITQQINYQNNIEENIQKFEDKNIINDYNDQNDNNNIEIKQNVKHNENQSTLQQSATNNINEQQNNETPSNNSVLSRLRQMSNKPKKIEPKQSDLQVSPSKLVNHDVETKPKPSKQGNEKENIPVFNANINIMRRKSINKNKDQHDIIQNEIQNNENIINQSKISPIIIPSKNEKEEIPKQIIINKTDNDIHNNNTEPQTQVTKITRKNSETSVSAMEKHRQKMKDRRSVDKQKKLEDGTFNKVEVNHHLTQDINSILGYDQYFTQEHSNQPSTTQYNEQDDLRAIEQFYQQEFAENENTITNQVTNLNSNDTNKIVNEIEEQNLINKYKKSNEINHQENIPNPDELNKRQNKMMEMQELIMNNDISPEELQRKLDEIYYANMSRTYHRNASQSSSTPNPYANQSSNSGTNHQSIPTNDPTAITSSNLTRSSPNTVSVPKSKLQRKLSNSNIPKQSQHTNSASITNSNSGKVKVHTIHSAVEEDDDSYQQKFKKVNSSRSSKEESKSSKLIHEMDELDPKLMEKLRKKAKKRIDSLDKMVENSKKVTDQDMSRRTRELMNNMGEDIADLQQNELDNLRDEV